MSLPISMLRLRSDLLSARGSIQNAAVNRVAISPGFSAHIPALAHRGDKRAKTQRRKGTRECKTGFRAGTSSGGAAGWLAATEHRVPVAQIQAALLQLDRYAAF